MFGRPKKVEEQVVEEKTSVIMTNSSPQQKAQQPVVESGKVQVEYTREEITEEIIELQNDPEYKVFANGLRKHLKLQRLFKLLEGN